MATGKMRGALGTIQTGGLRMHEGLQSKVVAPRNPKLVTEKEVSRMLTPSEFLKEMSLTTEQKLAATHVMCRPQIVELLDMAETTHQKFSGVDLDQTLFQPFPSEVIFQNYTPCEVYEVPLILRNNDKIPRLVKITQESSPYFTVISPNDIGHKVAPGVTSTFRILFTPEENKDYSHELTCVTEREKFIVPIKARGARAILDFPDQLNFSTCPVKYNTQKTLLIRNIGNREARFQIKTQSPFSAEPSDGILQVGESMQLTVEFEPQHVGNHHENLIVHYDTGEDIYVTLYGAASDVNIRLDKNSLTIEKTYISMVNQRTVTIHNRSNIITHFQWKIFATQEEEDEEKQRLCADLSWEEEKETDQFLEECSLDPSLRERLSILSRTFENHRKMVQGDAMLFLDNIFVVEPLEGDVWPNSTAEVNVIFNPREAKIYQQTVYCNISGREARLPLRIKGEGMGPKTVFNFDMLDIGKAFVGSRHSYEAILSNKGGIDALFNLIPPSTALGSCFTFNPNEGIIEPGGVQAIQISFSSAILGEFKEHFLFNVNGSPEPVKLTIRGCVIGPTFHFNVPALHFGDVSFGFPRTLTCSLNNTSLVPMTFKLRVPGDGLGEPSVPSRSQILDITRSSWKNESPAANKPQEFSINPSSGTIRSQGFAAIRVTLCSNTVKKYELALVVDVEGIGEEVLALLITARCIVPVLHVANPDIRFGRCFLKYPYEKMVRLVNDDELPGCYGVLPQECNKMPTVLFSSPSPCGVIGPHSTVDIPVTLETQIPGEFLTTAYIATYGSKEPPLAVHLKSTGEGPVVYVHPAQINFGSIFVLKDVSRTLQLSNQSFIPAHFRAQMAHGHSLWRIEPSEGVVPPETEVLLTLTAHLDDTLKFQDTVILVIENSNTYKIPVQALGIGTTIVTDKPFAPALNLGAHFSVDPCRYHFKITNVGRRTHQLYWMTEGFSRYQKRDRNPGHADGKASSHLQENNTPVFKLHPIRMEMIPGKTVDMLLEGYSATPRVVKERLLCHAIIGKKTGKEQIMAVDITCEFIAPLLQLSAKQLTFHVEKNPRDVLTAEFQPLALKNISSLPLSVCLLVKEPFFLCDVNQSLLPSAPQPIKLDTGAEKELSIKFDPSYKRDLNTRVAEEDLMISYLEHPHVDYLALRAEVHFPNLSFQTLSLNFGCILNDTEVIRHVEMTNCSPLLVKYRWSFLLDNNKKQIRFAARARKPSGAPLPSKSTELQEESQIDLPHVDSEDLIRDSSSKKSDEDESDIEKSCVQSAAHVIATEEQPLKTNTTSEERIIQNQSCVEYQESVSVMEQDDANSTGVEEVFDILPLYGVLQPNKTQQMSFTFYGHSDIIAEVKALCEVEGGPTYEIMLRGEASLVSYWFDTKEINFGLQLFDHIIVAEIRLKNTGKVGFEFNVLNTSQASPDSPPPGMPLILPSSGFIESEKEQILKLYYLPGVPEVFERHFQVQIAHLEPEDIAIFGEGTFPRICIDLPRNVKGNKKYETILRKARRKVEQDMRRDEGANGPDTATEEAPVEDSFPVLDALFHLEVERLIIQEHALEQQKLILRDSTENSPQSHRVCRKLVKAQLPEYILDFGYIILGNILTHVVKITNTSQFPVSFQAVRRALHDTGFSTELDRVKNLPYCEMETFEVKFDPQSANLPVGYTEVLLPIKVVGGPTFHISLRAKVTIPSLTMSCNKLEFATAQCGQCQMETIQLHNQMPVTCEWYVGTNKKAKKEKKYIPAYLRRKFRAELKPKSRIFEMIPPSGILDSGERINVQVKFMPAEEKFYSQYLEVHIFQSNQRLSLLVQGHGLEPRLDFNPFVLELGPLMPYSIGDEAEVVVKNPCNFPIEFYSLEFDQQYIEEEKILRKLKGYDSYNTLLLPPRRPGERLPPEVLEYYEEQKRLLEQQAKAKMLESLNQDNGENSTHREEEELSSFDQISKRTSLAVTATAASNSEENHLTTIYVKLEAEEEEENGNLDRGLLPASEKKQSIDSHCVEEVGELESNPVSKAVARHLGIDISSEGRAARNRRGIALIVHGAPLSGKTMAAVTLAKKYSAACVTIDSVVLEAISDGTSNSGLRARELCVRAAVEQSQRETEENGQLPDTNLLQTPVGVTRLSTEALAKHTSEGTLLSSEIKTIPQSATSRGMRGSVLAGKGKSEGHVSQSQKAQHQQHQSDATGSLVASSPVPTGPAQQHLSVSVSVGGEAGLMSCVLPEELLVDILAERMQLSDCYRGVVFDGLETLFARSVSSALLCLLKAINNREHIYFINLFQDFVIMKAREKAKKDQEEWKQQENLAKEKARLQELDEEEYDALTEEQKIQFDKDLLLALRERKKKELEKLARELQEKKLQQELERQREEEEMKKKSKKIKREFGKEDLGKKSQLGNRQPATFNPTIKSDIKLDGGLERKLSIKDQNSNEKDDAFKRKKSKHYLVEVAQLVHQPAGDTEEAEKDLTWENDGQLAQKFKMYESGLKDVIQILASWDRLQCVQLQPSLGEEAQHELEDQRQAPSGRKGRKDREKERLERMEKERAEKERVEKEKAEKERLEKLKAMEDKSEVGEGEGEDDQEGKRESGVPFLDFQILATDDFGWKQVLESDKLPAVEQILDALGLGPSGPPIPPPALFSVVPYPGKRVAVKVMDTLKHFVFVVPPAEDPAGSEEKKEGETEVDVALSTPAVKEEQITPTRGRQRQKEKTDQARESQKDKRRTTTVKKGIQGMPLGALAPLSDLDQSTFIGEHSQEKVTRLNHFRWIVPANGEVTLRVHFSSTEIGNFDQTLNFEVLGTHRLYQVYCRGVCTYPTISRDPKVVFPHRKKEIKPDEIVFKKYIMSLGMLQFGPLLCGKSRDKYKAVQYPNNMEKLTILNNSSVNVEVFFFFQHDAKANTYLLDPPKMKLKQNEKQILKVWAYPTMVGIFEDNIVCCIKENPEPTLFKICCQGVRPELELDQKQLHFDKLLLHRKDSKVIFLRNGTMLPVAWRINSLEQLGDDFSVSQKQGIIAPGAEYGLQLHFQASRPLNIRKTIRLEVTDVENILGVVQIENIQIVAEAYDVALDISFPKGTEGGLEFGIVRVMDEAKQSLSLKNKGKYEIGYSFSLESLGPNVPQVNSIISIQPMKGVLSPSDRPTNIQVTFRSQKEVKIENRPVLRCQVIEPNIAQGGEVIAIIPVKLSVISVFSKYSINPADTINFGAMISGSRKSASFVIENTGFLEFKFVICRMVQDFPLLQKKGGSVKRNRSRDGDNFSKSSSGKPVKNTDSVQKDMTLIGQARFTLGMFTIYPGFGSIPPGQQQVITVDCLADPLGQCEEFLTIEVTERDPNDPPNGIQYSLIAEACLPAFVIDDPTSIFEEHRICNNINLYQVLPNIESGGVFVEDENKFIFHNVLVGHQGKARFKISNMGKIPCDLNISVKPISNKAIARINDIFEVEPNKMYIPSRSHAFATVTFTPPTMQNYQCIFDASLEGLPSLYAKSRSLTFDITGDGNLPRVSIMRPIVSNNRGNPLLLFRRLRLSHSEKLPLIFKNNGTIPAQVHMDLLDECGVFSLKNRPTTQCIYLVEDTESMKEAKKPHLAFLIVYPGDTAEFDVHFKPRQAQKLTGTILLSVVDNQYEETSIQMIGEGYEDDITLDNIHGLVPQSSLNDAEENLSVNLLEASHVDHIQFGDCHVNNTYQVTFTITNHSQAVAIRFEWPFAPPLHFSPQVGHLHASCTKDITLTLKSDVTTVLRKMVVKCKVSKITFQLPADQIPDWDDCMRVVKWVDSGRSPSTSLPVKKKVIETDPEPTHTLLEDSSRELELQISAVVDYTAFKCEMENVQFKETLLFQTRVFKFEMTNTGNVKLDYNWIVPTGETGKTVSFVQHPNQKGSSSAHLTKRLSSQRTSLFESSSSQGISGDSVPPFSVEPPIGVIPAGNQQLFLIKFSPLEVGEFENRIFCRIPNLRPGEEGPAVTVKGQSLLPLCHFDLKDSDYISGHRRNAELRGTKGGSLDPKTRVIEFAALGVGSKDSRTFTIMNPTSSAYSFKWICEDVESLLNPPAFICLSEKGQIQPEKKVEITFQFIPHHLDITESLWTFLITEHNYSIPFLLVGKTSDPLISLDRAHFNYNSLLIGHEARETVYMINSENQAFSFAFREHSCFSEGFRNSVTVQPMEGLIPPLTRLPITIIFTPKLEGEVNLTLVCDIKKKAEPLTLNVKATGHQMNVLIKCREPNGSVTTLSLHQDNSIDFKEVEANECVQCEFTIFNTGKFNFNFSGEFCGPQALQRYFTFLPGSATVEAAQNIQAVLSFHPLKRCILKDMELQLKISLGPSYTCTLLGSAVIPSLHFSFTCHNFGICFIYSAGMPPYRHVLEITNREEKAVSLSCLYTNTAHLEVDFQAELLPPGKKLEVPIIFYPRDTVHYQEVIPFEINGLSQHTIEVQGKGIEMKVSVLEPASKIVKLGALLSGQKAKRTVTIVNQSLAPLTFNLTLMSSIPELQDVGVITLSPCTDLTLKPKETCKIEVTFSPKFRILPFTEEVLMDCLGLLRSLFALQGCCQALQVSLDQDYITFGAVVFQTQATRQFVVQNTGDLGTGFKWATQKCAPNFSISPVEGYITPGMTVTFEVTYHPAEMGKDHLVENVTCAIQGAQSLKLTLFGTCVGVSVIRETVNFSCQVRAKHTQTILLSNRSSQMWNLQPIFEGEHWEGPEFVILEAHQQNKPYEITYRPLTMNTENRKHQGSLFFPLPDGTGWMYTLQGTAEPPKSLANILREIPCKTSYVELLSVTNWLNKPQRFRITVDMIKPEKLDLSTTLKGLDYIDVPAASKKDYQLRFFSYKEGLFNAKVIFRNEETLEYFFYTVSFKAVPSGAVGTIEMVSSVRQSASSSVKVENPLPYAVTFSTDCRISDINLPSQFVVPAQSEGVLVFEFQPLKAGETSGRLTLQNNELGVYHYELALKAIAAQPEKPVYFRVMLGGSQSTYAKFINYTRQRAEYICKLDSADFHTDKLVNAAPGSQGGTEVSLEVIFEPSQLGECRSTLTLTSPTGGEYIIPLIGTALPPKPQGPFQIRMGFSTTISFKNIFHHTTAFSFHVENPAFSIKAPDSLRSKKTSNVLISFEGNPSGSKAPITSKLVVSCPHASGTEAGIKWIYYLRGITPEK
ncbi:hydrocephalus-inducing protein homolog isoform X2 [Ornithorhynchus anatinus]|uniref:hydrocephalus-inducing protein homolog isoform X2 n=1 Tax=Ornithorhynchus anatinus TaxID=9258 RepID=UPI0019D4CC5D|nr:hydrocephalus-inducing protein homolog isoform X2 [Ornithorhynchus anatinus]